MQIDRIHYQKVFPVGAYLTERIGFEAELAPDDNPIDAINHLRSLAEGLHREKFPHYYADGIDPQHKEEPFVQIREDEPPIAESPEDKRWLAITDGCFSEKELQKWRAKCPAWIYDRRHEQLSTQFKDTTTVDV
jgi:hypothetical protein